MRIVCPSCQAVYEVPDTLLARGPAGAGATGEHAPVRLRCARCATEWTPPELAAPPPTPAPEPPLSPPLSPPGPTPSAFADALARGVPAGKATTPEAPHEAPPASPSSSAPEREEPVALAEPAPAASDPRTPPAGIAPPHPPQAGDRLLPDHVAAHRQPHPPSAEHAGADRATPWLGWLVTAAVLIAAVVAAWFEREAVMRSWPPAARIYDLLGLR